MIYDVIVVGGSFAGLSAAMPLARARRQVLVIDAGEPRNRYAEHSHGVLGHDGKPGSELLGIARLQLAQYATVSMVSGVVSAVQPQAGEFQVVLETGETIEGKRVVLATGMRDTLPEIPGLAERWGKTVMMCPYCHGYELGGGSLGVLASSPMSVMQACIVADWGDVTLFTDGKLELDDAQREMLVRRRIKVETQPVAALEGPLPAIRAVRLTDKREVPVRALFIGVPARQASPLAEQLGCAFDEAPSGLIVRTDEWKQTTVSGVYAAGDAAYAMPNITLASADGLKAGVGAHHSLIFAEAGL